MYFKGLRVIVAGMLDQRFNTTCEAGTFLNKRVHSIKLFYNCRFRYLLQWSINQTQTHTKKNSNKNRLIRLKLYNVFVYVNLCMNQIS